MKTIFAITLASVLAAGSLHAMPTPIYSTVVFEHTT